MKAYIRRLIAAICLLCAFCGTVPAQDVKESPRYGIRYIADGWDELTPNVIEKRSAKIERKFGATIAADWRFQAERLRILGEWIDEDWSRRVEAWSRCTYVGDIDPRRLFIRIEGDTFTLPQYPEYHSIWGTVDTGARNIRVTSWAYIKGYGTVNAVDTIEWEMGNAIQILKRGLVIGISGEIGSRDPCK